MDGFTGLVKYFTGQSYVIKSLKMAFRIWKLVFWKAKPPIPERGDPKEYVYDGKNKISS
jgi:hypothetical protein